MFAQRRLIWIAALGSWCALGCVAKDYQYGHFRTNAETPVDIVVERGEPEPPSSPDKNAFFSRFEKTPFELDFGTAVKVEDYIRNNDLHDLRIEVRYHNTSEQWRRLKGNTRLSALWRWPR